MNATCWVDKHCCGPHIKLSKNSAALGETSKSETAANFDTICGWEGTNVRDSYTYTVNIWIRVTQVKKSKKHETKMHFCNNVAWIEKIWCVKLLHIWRWTMVNWWTRVETWSRLLHRFKGHYLSQPTNAYDVVANIVQLKSPGPRCFHGLSFHDFAMRICPLDIWSTYNVMKEHLLTITGLGFQ